MNAAILVKPVESSNVKLSSTQIIVSGLRAAQDEAHAAAYEAGFKSFFDGEATMAAKFAGSPLALSWLAGRDAAAVDDLEMFEMPVDGGAHEQVARFF
ncbi:hypothetical protein [Paraburkholderia youngii]|uniref:hypothetical protein n=1 Tax=Paraburkholderia youngii TaxID=2782701 RepID=UPI003D24E830